MNLTATILRNEFAVVASTRGLTAHLTVQVPNGWDDVQNLLNKALSHDGRRYTFSGWNSDRNEAYFARPINGDASTATIAK